MQPDTLRAVLTALWGPGFLAPAAVWLGRHKSQVSNWCTGRDPIPRGVVPRLLAAIPTREAELRDARATLRRAA